MGRQGPRLMMSAQIAGDKAQEHDQRADGL